MPKLEIKTAPQFVQVFDRYPEKVQDKMHQLRALVLETASETASITTIEECLKWGEPSYICKHGSTLRMDWKAKKPGQYALYFQCSSRLVETFKMMFGNQLNFEGKRAIILQLEEELPTDILKQCIKATLTYHKVKHLPTLGI